MEAADLEAVSRTAPFFIVLALLVVVGLMVGILYLGWWISSRQGSLSPYSHKPMGRGEDLAYSAVERVSSFLDKLEQSDNRPFAMKYAAFCRQTGRIFPSSRSLFGWIRIRKNFLNHRYDRPWVSWGSLSPLEQGEVRRCHDSLDGFQTEVSCPRPRPEDIDAYYSMVKPGPLYVDLSSKELLGWKRIPGTQLEVLIVQHPRYELVHSLEETKDTSSIE